ncbi:MAG: 2-amino-4-hydroxy-6-hydroxymethyldihydropteridine diphosphokinase [Sulfurospirillum sp.]|nr:MAG: 2-amino-4-hydroxy-6-hydroxymethyldihydropteridine diphosphokinase [Sulfurospirillum sp.]
MRKRLSAHLTLCFDKYFPWQNPHPFRRRHTAILGIGGNIGNTRRRFAKLLRHFRRQPQITVLETSPILKNPPFGYTDQKDFYNAVILIETNLSPSRLLRYALRTEHIFKRKRAFKNSPRTLDVDIIVFDKIAVHKRHLTLPHPHFRKRESVLIPLSYLKRGLYETVHIHGADTRRSAQKGTTRLR